MTDFPEPNNGRATMRSTGPRREEYDEPASPRGLPCHHCGLTIHRVYTLADVGAFCSPRCRSQHTDAPTQQQKVG